jgi:hypothetical protein
MVAEARLDTSTEVANATLLEICNEASGLLALNFPVLDRCPTEVLIQLHSFEGSHCSLI